MTSTNVLFARIRNAEGKYLGGEGGKVDFFDDLNRAIVFDCRRSGIEEQIEQLGRMQGVFLELVPVDPKEIHEACDQCGRLAMPFQMYFDGQHYFCGHCRPQAAPRPTL